MNCDLDDPDVDFHDFFNHLRGHGGAIMHGKGTSFCRRWIDSRSGEIWCLETGRFSHRGPLAHPGDYGVAKSPTA